MTQSLGIHDVINRKAGVILTGDVRLFRQKKTEPYDLKLISCFKENMVCKQDLDNKKLTNFGARS